MVIAVVLAPQLKDEYGHVDGGGGDTLLPLGPRAARAEGDGIHVAVSSGLPGGAIAGFRWSGGTGCATVLRLNF